MDKYMKAITKQMLTIESLMQGGTKQTKWKNGKNAKGCWSDRMVKQTEMYRMTLTIAGQCSMPSRREQAKKNTSKIPAACRTEYHDLYSEIGMPPPIQTTHQQWKKYENRIRGIVKKLMRGMHARRRRKWKTEMKKYKQRREQQRKSPQGLKPYTNYVPQRPTQEEKPWVLMKETKEGGIKVIDTRGTVEKAEREFTETHKGKGRRRWYIQQG